MDRSEVEEDIYVEDIFRRGAVYPPVDALAPGRERAAECGVARHHAPGAIGHAKLI